MGPPRCGNIFLASAIRLRYPDETRVIEPGNVLPDGTEIKHSIQNVQTCAGSGIRVLSPVRCPREAAESFLRFQGTTSHAEDEVAGYLRHYRSLLRAQTQAEWTFVDFTNLIQGPQEALDDVGRRLPLTGRVFVVRWGELRSDTTPSLSPIQVPKDLWRDKDILTALHEAHEAFKGALQRDCGCTPPT